MMTPDKGDDRTNKAKWLGRRGKKKVGSQLKQNTPRVR